MQGRILSAFLMLALGLAALAGRSDARGSVSSRLARASKSALRSAAATAVTVPDQTDSAPVVAEEEELALDAPALDVDGVATAAVAADQDVTDEAPLPPADNNAPAPLPAAPKTRIPSRQHQGTAASDIAAAATTLARTRIPSQTTPATNSTPAFLFSGAPVLALAPQDFVRDRLVVSAAKLVFVNFYSSSCGHCIAHAPTWRLIALSFSNLPKVAVAALDCDQYQHVCTTFNVSGTPFIKSFANGVPDDGPALPEDYEYFVASVRLRFGALPANEAASAKLVNQVHPHDKRRKKSALGPKLRVLADAASAVRYGLNVGVFLGRYSISGPVLDALVAWLDLLSHAFPSKVGRWKLAWLKAQILERSQTPPAPAGSSDRVLHSHVFEALMEGWDFANTHNEPFRWHHCQGLGADEPGGGFSCGQWLLFHLIAAQVSRAPRPSAAMEIHGFVKHFFGCVECRENFLKKNPHPPQLDTNHAPALAMWLWREHNLVSARLNVEHTEDQATATAPLPHFHEKVQFPAKDACRACYRADGGFDEQVVERYLQLAYGVDQTSDWEAGEEEGAAVSDSAPSTTFFVSDALSMDHALKLAGGLLLVWAAMGTLWQRRKVQRTKRGRYEN